MNSKELYELWAPDFREWSRWSKPVAFAGAAPGMEIESSADAIPIDISWAPASKDTVIVVDVGGALAVRIGVALISRGYWPVPLFNAAESPYRSAVPTTDIRQELWDSADALRMAPADPALPPAFLLDANRLAPRPKPGEFDNRWLTFPQDFPSANLLLSRGLGKVIVHQSRMLVAQDLAHVLVRWQEAGIQIDLKVGDRPIQPTTVAKPRSFRNWMYVAIALMGLRQTLRGDSVRSSRFQIRAEGLGNAMKRQAEFDRLFSPCRESLNQLGRP